VSVTTEASVVVGIHALQQAVAAVLPHAEKPKLGDDPTIGLDRVRVTAGKDELLLAATNGRTTALAAVRILEDSRAERFAADDGVFSLDLHPKILRDLRDGVTAQRNEGDLQGDAEVTFTDPGPGGQQGTVGVRDVSGLWPGALTVRPALPLSADYPDVVAALRGALGAAEGAYKPLVADGPDLAAFAAAARAYDEALQVEPVGQPGQRGWLVLCGPSFAGTVQGMHGEDSLARRDRTRTAHLTRLGLAERTQEMTL